MKAFSVPNPAQDMLAYVSPHDDGGARRDHLVDILPCVKAEDSYGS